MYSLRILPLALCALSNALSAQTITVLVKDGDVIPGVGAVTAIDNLIVNKAGTWMVEVTTNAATNTSVVLRNGVALLRDGDSIAPAPATVSSFDDFTLNEAGTSGWNIFLSGLTTSTDSGVYVDTTLVIQESNNSTAPQYTGPAPYTGFFGAKWNDIGQLLVLASVDDPLITGIANRALIRLQLDPSNVLLFETVLLKAGDMVTGFGAETLSDFQTSPYTWAMNSSGSVLYTVDMTGPTTTDVAIVVDGVVIAREGDPSPIMGRSYEFLSSRSADLSDGGHVAFRANLDGATQDDEVVIANGVIVAQEANSLPSIAPFVFDNLFGTIVRIDSTGHVYWYGDWNDPDSTRDSAIFVDGQILVQEGVTTAGGIVISSIASVIDTMAISADGRYVIFEGQLTGGIDAAFLVDRLGNTPTPFCFGDGTGTACPCANNGAAGHGCASSTFTGGAVLASSGMPGASASTDTLVLTANDITGPGLFFQGDGQLAGGLGIPFSDGLLCAGGAILRLGVVFPTGSSASYPGGLTPNPIHIGGATSPGNVRHYQCWYRDAVAFCTANTNNLTQGLTLTWTP